MQTRSQHVHGTRFAAYYVTVLIKRSQSCSIFGGQAISVQHFEVSHICAAAAPCALYQDSIASRLFFTVVASLCQGRVRHCPSPSNSAHRRMLVEECGCGLYCHSFQFSGCSMALSSWPLLQLSGCLCEPIMEGVQTTTSWVRRVASSLEVRTPSRTAVATLSPQLFSNPHHRYQLWLWPKDIGQLLRIRAELVGGHRRVRHRKFLIGFAM